MGSARRRQLGLATSGMRDPLPGRDGSYERALAMRSRVPPLDRARAKGAKKVEFKTCVCAPNLIRAGAPSHTQFSPLFSPRKSVPRPPFVNLLGALCYVCHVMLHCLSLYYP